MYPRIGYSLIVLFSVITCGSLKEIPDYIKICKWNPATIDACVKDSIESLRPHLNKGIQELEVPGIEPFYISELVAINNNSSPLHAVGKDIKVTGAGNFIIENLSIDLDNFVSSFRVKFEKLFFKGKYKVDIQLLLPLKGEGTMTAESKGVVAEFVLRSQPVHKDGKEYIKFTSLDTNIDMKDYKVKLEGLFNGDKVLGDAANEAINQNKADFLKATKPSLEATISKLLLESANKIVYGLTFDQLIPKP
ncbi:hypothetical protein K1T71_003461 [Dendrolimus kikuchii]|uniref:Uncharacterized protein n=1 Tax=Dendrolimus kikuchii TaxID=765133 RepID=A0ACC1DBV0_9NEOP|nr:hypothetical protein K1T71_003461 [Dendrolimus kikuchii]